MSQPDLFESRASLSVTCLCGRSVAVKLVPLSALTFRSADIACAACGLRLKVTGMLPEGNYDPK